MSTIADILQRPPSSIAADHSVKELRRLFGDTGHTMCYVVDDGVHVDIISTREAFAAHPNRLVMDIRKLPRVRIDLDTQLDAALELLVSRKAEIGLVMDNRGLPVGAVDVDVLRREMERRRGISPSATVSKPVKYTSNNLSLPVRHRYRADSMSERADVVRCPQLRTKLVGCSQAIEHIRIMASAAATSNAPVLITGETGTGKQVVAELIREVGELSRKPFVCTNCASFQETLFESEFFGHEKGAFTGAVNRKKGLVESAEGGTLFLDEVAELSPVAQAKLLHVLDHGAYRRLGGTTQLKAHFRLIAATNRELESMAKTGDFREDLFYRLNVIRIHIPPLRERKEDIPRLVSHFLAAMNQAERRPQPAFIQALCTFDWPGNVRQLQNTLSQAVFLAGDSHVLDTVHLPPMVGQPAVASLARAPVESLKASESRLIASVLQEANGNKSLAARRLGISRATLRRKLNGADMSDLPGGIRDDTSNAGQ